MTINHRMKAPKEMATETFAPASDSSVTRKRMDRICATPEEIALYHYNPNAARNNLRPGIPCEVEDTNSGYED